MREQFEEIKNGCPWIIIKDEEDPRRYECRATKVDCWYKGCAILYWLRNLINTNDLDTSMRKYFK